MYGRREQVITRSHELIDRPQKSVVLTFDDGPGKYLHKILNILKEEEVPAAFFWQSRLLYPERPWRKVLEAGHIIGSHSCKHRNLTTLDYRGQFNELFRSKLKLENITGQPVRYFRPPFGQYNTHTLRALKELDMKLVMWSIASLDWELKAKPKEIIPNVISHLEEGAIILLHELAQTVLVLPQLIREIRNEGYSFTVFPKG